MPSQQQHAPGNDSRGAVVVIFGNRVWTHAAAQKHTTLKHLLVEFGTTIPSRVSTALHRICREGIDLGTHDTLIKPKRTWAHGSPMGATGECTTNAWISYISRGGAPHWIIF